MRRFRAFIVLLFVSSFAWGNWDSFAPYYEQALRAQNTGKYAEWIWNLPNPDQIRKDVRSALTAQLEIIRMMDPANREKELVHILRYYSEAHGSYLESGVEFESHVKYAWQDLVAGNYESEDFAKRLVRRMREFDEELLYSLLSQIQAQILSEFPDRNYFCLGRDFTVAYLYFLWQKGIPQDRLFTLNISRKIRDIVLSGQTAALRTLIYGLGLTKEKLLNQGLVFLDSSKGGKIPRAVLKALVEEMTDAEATLFLQKVAVRYVKSSTGPGAELSARVSAVLGGRPSLTRAEIQQLTTETWGIPQFVLNLPAAYAGHDISNNHHFFEHRPKFLTTAQNFQNGQLYSPPPATPSERANALLGLYSDLKLADRIGGLDSHGAEEVPAAPAPQPAAAIPAPGGEAARPVPGSQADAQLQAVYQEIEQVAAGGPAVLKQWQSQVSAETQQVMASVRLSNQADADFPFLLESPYGSYRLRALIGEGNNVRAYLTEKWTVLKVIKNAGNARKQILQAWMDSVLDAYGIDHARTLWVAPTGILLEQEYIASDSLEVQFGHGQELPPDIRAHILDHWRKALRLVRERQIYLDLKAANYHMKKGKPHFVDYTPRLNGSQHMYFFQSEGGAELTEEEFLDRFLHHMIQAGRGQPAIFANCRVLLERHGIPWE